MTFYIAPIVEGDTETGCIERLLQRIWSELLGASVRLQVAAPSRGNRASLVHPNRPDLAEKEHEPVRPRGPVSQRRIGERQPPPADGAIHQLARRRVVPRLRAKHRRDEEQQEQDARPGCNMSRAPKAEQ